MTRALRDKVGELRCSRLFGDGEIWNSLYDRRTYAATDNIIVDFQSEGHAMGEEFATDRPPRLDVRVIGTGPIARIDIIKDNTFVYTAHPDVEEVSFSYTDRSIEPGTHYYYVRVIQADDNMAWASPIGCGSRSQGGEQRCRQDWRHGTLKACATSLTLLTERIRPDASR